MENKLIVACAGAGKTFHLVNETNKHKSESILITTYTEDNAEVIKKELVKKYSCVPKKITVQTWFSFLIQHGVKPYQGTFNEGLFDYKIKGMIFNNNNYGSYYNPNLKQYVPFSEEDNFMSHYFTNNDKILSDRLSKFVFKVNKSSNGEVINRISRIYKHIFIDEVQDLAGYDLEILKLLFKSNSNILMVGDPRQVTYLTSHLRKHNQYKKGKIKDFINEKCGNSIPRTIDETSLVYSHRNNKEICEFSSKLYEDFPTSVPCTCEIHRDYSVKMEGVFLVRPKDVNEYLSEFSSTIQLRWNVNRKVHPNYDVLTFGGSKGKTFERVLIYPTRDMEKWVYNHQKQLEFGTKAKFYVAITRAKYSVAIVSDYSDNVKLNGMKLYKTNIAQ